MSGQRLRGDFGQAVLREEVYRKAVPVVERGLMPAMDAAPLNLTHAGARARQKEWGIVRESE